SHHLVPVPPGLHAQVVTNRLSASWIVIGAVAVVLAWLVIPLSGRQAGGEVVEADLVAASGSRTVRVGVGPDRRVEVMPVEVYVSRVLAGEGEPKAAEAAHQALAIAIRTYAAANQSRHQRDGYDLCDTTHCQVVRASTPASRRATQATAGQVLLHQGRPAELFYSASCGGRTEAAATVWRGMQAYPYLRSVEDHAHADDAPWTLELTVEVLVRALSRVGVAGDSIRSISVEQRTASGRVGRLKLNGLRPAEISGEEFRAAVGPTVIRSTAFSVQRTRRGYEFTGRGYGHGVGMCVIGAGRLAARGERADQILNLYYPGLQLMTLSGGLSQSQAPPRAPAASAAPSPRSGEAPVPPRPAPAPVTVRVEDEAAIDRPAIEALAASAYAYLSGALGVAQAPVTIDVHATLDGFRTATGRPWWVNSRVAGTVVDLPPPVLLAQREGLAFTVRAALAEALVAGTLAGRAEWVRIGAARYYARLAGGTPPAPPRSEKLLCPSDGELTMSLSAAAQREAEQRAEACFVRARTRVADWRAVR
ncbi:MAG: SpoIID/LytB domain-containing protein, partial [Vicinamibacterales bacterium]|nr:SpoIID/LytB domain-containing protein [Vicinamibacterales bacterium]